VVVQPFVLQSAVDDFDTGILHRFAWLDGCHVTASIGCPPIEASAPVLTLRVEGQPGWFAAGNDHPFRRAHDGVARRACAPS